MSQGWRTLGTVRRARSALIIGALVVAVVVALARANLAWLLGIVIFVLALLISVMLHELGHFLTAKKFHMKVTQFFVGFGQTLWSTMRGETEYGVKALPFGGFVKIVGMSSLEEVDEQDEPRTFRRQPAWQRAVVLVAGSFMHFALAFVLLAGLALGIGVQNTTVIGRIASCVPASAKALDQGTCQGSLGRSPAAVAGIRAGDTVTKIGSRPVHTWVQLGEAIRVLPPGKPVPVVVKRDGVQHTLSLTPAAVPGRKGSFFGVDEKIFKRVGPITAVSYAGTQFGDVLASSGSAIAKLPSALPDLFASDRAKTPAGNVSSVVGAADIAGQAVEQGGGWQFTVSTLLLIVISLNIFVGAFNLLPLLPLDGGHLALVIYEKIRSWLARLRRRPDPGLVDLEKLLPVSIGVFALLVGLAVVLIAADIFNPIHLPQ
ncbi:MAG TPA: site-2 protease family protein [Streptosporangiaceae bacterium]|jgi:membrane-associated protease RseP (regulator of RpoE activity)